MAGERDSVENVIQSQLSTSLSESFAERTSSCLRRSLVVSQLPVAGQSTRDGDARPERILDRTGETG